MQEDTNIKRVSISLFCSFVQEKEENKIVFSKRYYAKQSIIEINRIRKRSIIRWNIQFVDQVSTESREFLRGVPC